MQKYFSNIKDTFSSLFGGVKLTFKHLKDARFQHDASNVQSTSYFSQDKGIVTLSYPFESLPIPDHSRYRLHNEIEDCIVCDKCAVVCPVDCIAIETIKTPEAIGETSDGSVKRLWAEKFDIDMAKCCFCGLCTTVCPTECLTMTKVYDFSEVDIRNMNYHFTNLTPELAEDKKRLYDQFVKEKEELKKQKAEASVENKSNLQTDINTEKPIVSVGVKPAYKPSFKPILKTEINLELKEDENKNLNEDQNKDVKLELAKQQNVEQSQEKPIENDQPLPEIKNVITATTQQSAKPVYKPVIRKPNPPISE
jgi:formate hydrogenlyase subunit 6/NADH:ubiquinone oxidoreductase subunit I